MRHPSRHITYRARLVTEEARARHVADILSELLDPACAVCGVSELRPGRWCVDVHFVSPLDESTLRDLIAAQFNSRLAQALKCTALPPRDWPAASLAALAPVRAGRFVVHGAHARGRLRANDIAIEIEAGLAFGTGHHGTTRGCLVALDRLAKANRRPPRKLRENVHFRCNPQTRASILDLGTGSGVLAIAAAKIFRTRVLATDHDARAVQTARANASTNRTAPLIEVMHAAGFNAAHLRASRQFALVLANILLAPLRRMAAPMALRIKPAGHAVISGLLSDQANAAISAYRAQSLILERRIVLDGWATLVFRKATLKQIRAAKR
ncbi:MAG TPA: 50S ribosomal protein L11 methyltransferase [Xanthobacteraceae bacterium]|nr:50S ribosomal protein L11 methyltransferase [Xanthobacteraceae bacterium]